MRQGLKKYIEKHKLSSRSDKILVAVSGGIDSVVLIDLLVKASFSCSIAHCNFLLRGEESDEDELFVRGLGEKYNIKTYVQRFDTLSYAKEQGISTQMAARDLRYTWFNVLIESHEFKSVAIAHNSDDQVETLHLNLARGTGISGITGMSPKSGNIIRPILWASRKVISEYCINEKLQFREDSSNRKTDYKRNFLRHEILPKFEKLNQSYSETIIKNIENFRQSSEMLDFLYHELVNKIIIKSRDEIKLSISNLIELPEPSWFLFRFLSQYGFTSSQVADIADSLNAEPGKGFETELHTLLKDREWLIISEKQKEVSSQHQIEKISGSLSMPIKLDWSTQDIGQIDISKDAESACIDFAKLKFPLLLRKWQPGDSFYPFGMTRKKKLSDFFIDNKLSLLEKQKTWLLLSDNQIVWVIGQRIDNRVRISDKTKRIFRMRVG